MNSQCLARHRLVSRLNRLRLTHFLLLFALALFITSGAVAKATDYNDGGTHTISGSDTNVVISNGTTVNIVSGATVIGPYEEPFGHDAIQMQDASSSINVTGGTITGGGGSYQGGGGIIATNGSLDISGGDFTGGDGSTVSPFYGGGPGVYANDFQSFSISGGMFTGGEGEQLGGNAVHINTFTPKTAYVSGGTFDGGAGAIQDSGYDLLVTGPIQVEITNGDFVGYHSAIKNNAVANVSGGHFVNLLEAWDEATINFSGGQIGQLLVRDTAEANISDGSLYGVDLYGDGVANVTGGQLQYASTIQGSGILNLSGGEILGVESFIMADSSVLNVYGYGLTLDNVGGPWYQLQGMLADGTTIGEYNGLTLLNDDAVVNLIEVPEPTTLMLAIAGAICLPIVSWYRRRKHACGTYNSVVGK